jgi:hypothetical protein
MAFIKAGFKALAVRKEREAVQNGAGDRIRTGDIDLGKVALYQLSYSRISQRQAPLSRPKRRLSNSFQGL